MNSSTDRAAKPSLETPADHVRVLHTESGAPRRHSDDRADRRSMAGALDTAARSGSVRAGAASRSGIA